MSPSSTRAHAPWHEYLHFRRWTSTSAHPHYTRGWPNMNKQYQMVTWLGKRGYYYQNHHQNSVTHAIQTTHSSFYTQNTSTVTKGSILIQNRLFQHLFYHRYYTSTSTHTRHRSVVVVHCNGAGSNIRDRYFGPFADSRTKRSLTTGIKKD